MRISAKKRITAIDLIYWSIYIMVLIWCLPLTMVLPSIIRRGLQLLGFLLFIAGLLIYKKKIRLLQYILIVVFVTVFVYGVWQNKKTISSCAISVLSGWEFCCFGLILRSEKDPVRKKKLLLFVIAIMLITCVTTIIGIQRYPLVVRELGRSTRSYSGLTGDAFDLVKREYRLSNIAGWNQLYGIAFLIPCLVFLFKMTRKKTWLVCIAIGEICVIRSQLTFALLLSVSLIVFVLINPGRNRKKVIGLTILLFVGLVMAFNIDVLILSAVSLTRDVGFSMLSTKLYDLYLVTQGISGGDALARMNLYQQSLEIFRVHPAFGSFAFGNYAVQPFSQHSDFFDMMAFYGIFGIAIVIYMVFRYLSLLIRKSWEDKWISFILFIGFLSMFVFNPIWYSPQIFICVFMMPEMISSAYKEINAHL